VDRDAKYSKVGSVVRGGGGDNVKKQREIVATGEGEKKMCESKKVLIEVVVQVECTRTIHIYRVYLLSAIVGKWMGMGTGGVGNWNTR